MDYFNEYLLGSTIHGLRYMTGAEKWPVRLTWFIIVGVKFGLVAYSIYSFNRQWKENPVVSTMNTIG